MIKLAVNSEDLIKRRDGLMYLENSIDPYTGICKDFYPNKSPKKILTYKRGKLRGPCIFYHENGEIRLEGQHKYQNSVMDGFITTYHKNGKIYQHAHLGRTIIDGSYWQYDNEGNLEKSRNYFWGLFFGYMYDDDEYIDAPYKEAKRKPEAQGYYDEDKEILVALPRLLKDEKDKIKKVKEWFGKTETMYMYSDEYREHVKITKDPVPYREWGWKDWFN